MEDNELKQLQKYGATERFYTESKLYPDYQLARVIAQYRGKYKVITDQQEFLQKFLENFDIQQKNWFNFQQLEILLW